MQMDPRVPTELGDYQPLEFIGRGGMGEVWLASSQRLTKPCVLKILRPRLARVPKNRRRFFREAEIGAGMGHGRIVAVTDFGEAHGYLYLVMAYVDGIDLAAFCRALAAGGERIPIAGVAYIIGEVFEALHHAHNRTRGGKPRAVIHRDVTPSNVLVSSEGEVFLTDFGIARYESDFSCETFGTLQYMAPEQARGAACFASDIYGAAGVLHFMLTGEPPRQVANARELQQVLDAPPPPTGRSDVPERLERLRAMGLAPDPEQRLGSADEARVLIDGWRGYQKATRLLAQFYRRYIGPPRSGVTGLMRAAEAAAAEGRTRSAAVAQEPQAPPEESARMTVKISPKETPPEDDDPEAEDDGSWNRRWWRSSEEDPLESCKTRRFLPPKGAVEADAPRMLRRPHRRPLDPPADLGSPSPEARS